MKVMLGRLFRRALGTRRRIHPMTEERRTTNDAIIEDEYSLHPESEAGELRLLRRLSFSGVTIRDVIAMLDLPSVADAQGRSEDEPLSEESYIVETSSETIRGPLVFKLLSRKMYTKSSGSGAESCCICQEDYEGGDEVAVLRCRHEFHASCITRWLTQKNVCPVCKETAI